VLEYVDYEKIGLFSCKQVGQVLVLLGIFQQLFADVKTWNPDRKAREEVFLMHFWYLINPLHNKETVECRILFTLLKVVYDPYSDGSTE
jgi:hypothetical protein